MSDAYFHEDDFCQIELAPEANWEFCARQMGEIETFSEAHRDGAGWIDMFVRGDNPAPFQSLGISRSDLSKSMPAAFPQFDQVFTGYSSYRESCPQTTAFGRESGIALFAQYNDAELITAAWCAFDITTEHDVESAMALIDSLSQWPLLLADWGWSALLRIQDRDLCNQYFNKRRQVFGQPDE